MVIILHNIRSQYNVGSIFRTADAAGVEKLYICGVTSAPVDRFGKVRSKIAKTALGAEALVSWDGSARSPRAVYQLIARLKKDGYKIVAIEQDKRAIPYYKLDSRLRGNDKLALVLGAEVTGLPKTILAKCDTIVEIPMRGAMVRQTHHPRITRRGKWFGGIHHKESLNVSVAFGIIVFHALYS